VTAPRVEMAAPRAIPLAWPATIAVVGAGRAGGALAAALAAAGHPVTAIAGRDPGRAGLLAARVGARPAPTPLAAILAADLTFLTVPDTAVAGVAASVAAGGTDLSGHGGGPLQRQPRARGTGGAAGDRGDHRLPAPLPGARRR